MKKIGIYIHFPFCVSKCKYCNFVSFSGKNDMQLKYFQALIREISQSQADNVVVDTIFIGGGTPSVMFDGCVSTLLSEIRKKFTVLDDAEITIEGNPNSITLAKAREWKECGINRVSIGLQATNPNILRLIGRQHTKQDYVRAVEIVQSVGITNINTDCLVGLPRQRQTDVRKTLSLVTKLGCTHVSVYSLILEDDTPLARMVDSGEVKLPKEEKTLGMYNFAYNFLENNGFHRYEVSNFALGDNECKHNLNTWSMHEYLGFGVGAHSFLNGKRWHNVDTIEEYTKLVDSDKNPIAGIETISSQELFEETIMLGLRTVYGINLADIKNRFDIDLREVKKDIIDNFCKNNLIIIDGDTLKATSLGFAVLNKIILELVC